MTQIKSIKIDGLRGVRGNLILQLNGKSALIYGDNGSGKSCISDVLEWFYNDRVDHLSNEEIGRNGLEALRNVFLGEDLPGSITVTFNNNSLDATKTISVGKKGLAVVNTNDTPEFQNYMSVSHGEQLLLRYRDLANFILGSKTDRLKEFSDIIGYADVTAVRDVLRKTANSLKNEIKVHNFEQGINQQQGKLIVNLGQNITSIDQFLMSINVLVKPLLPGREISSRDEIDGILELLKGPGDAETVDKQRFFNRNNDFATEFASWLDEIDARYAEYETEFQNMIKDIEKIGKLIMESLLSAGLEVLNSGVFIAEQCPLCLQPKNPAELSAEIQTRLAELEQIKKEKNDLLDSATRLNEIINAKILTVKDMLKEKYFALEENKALKEEAEKSITAIEPYLKELNIQPSPNIKLRDSDELRPDRGFLHSIEKISNKKIEELKKEKKTTTNSTRIAKSLYQEMPILKLNVLRPRRKNWRNNSIVWKRSIPSFCDSKRRPSMLS